MTRSKVKSRSHHKVTHLHPQPTCQPHFNFLHLMVSEIQHGQTFSCRPLTHLVNMGENNKHTVLTSKSQYTTNTNITTVTSPLQISVICKELLISMNAPLYSLDRYKQVPVINYITSILTHAFISRHIN